MKILITTQYFYPENFRINDFAFKMVKRGHEVSVITGVPNYPEGKFFGDYKILGAENIEGVKVYRVPLISGQILSLVSIILQLLWDLLECFFQDLKRLLYLFGCKTSGRIVLLLPELCAQVLF